MLRISDLFILLSFYSDYHTGSVTSTQPQASYHRPKKDVMKHQYYRMNWKLELMPLAQKAIKNLTTDAVQVSKYLDPLFHKLLSYCLQTYARNLRSHCAISILTLGNKRFLGFGSSVHKDPKDQYSPELNECLFINVEGMIQKYSQ